MPATKSVTALLVAGGVALAGALGSASPASAEPDTILAIVYSPATGAYGWANDSSDSLAVYNIAMQQCQNAGGTDCRLLGNAVNSCAALAVHVGRYDLYRAEFNHANRIAADYNALRINKGGYILLSRCSTGDDGIG